LALVAGTSPAVAPVPVASTMGDGATPLDEPGPVN
jgi:hypothetical protein